MKKLVYSIGVAAAFALPAAAAPAPHPPRVPAIAGSGATIATFGTGEVKRKDDGSYVIKNDPGEYGGVYYTASPHTKVLSELTFKFKTDGDVQGGAPRWSIPIDTNGERETTEGYAFIDAAGCGAAVGTNDANTVTTVSTTKPNCQVFFLGATYANWQAFVAAHTDYQLSRDTPFVIADVAGKYHVYGFVFG